MPTAGCALRAESIRANIKHIILTIMKIRTLIALSLLAITGTVATASPPASSYMPASATLVAERISSISLPGAGIVNHRSADLGKTLLPVGNAQGTSASAPKLLPEPGRNAISRVSLSGAKMYTWIGMTDTSPPALPPDSVCSIWEGSWPTTTMSKWISTRVNSLRRYP